MRLLRKIHLWLSVPFGLIITLVCFSGAMLVFEKELTRLFGDNIYKVERAVGEPLPMSVIVENVAPTLPRGVRITGVTVSHDPEEAYRVNLSKPKHAAVTVDQYTGEVIGRQERTAFFSAMFRLHRWLLDSARPEGRPAWGKLVVGVSTLMFVVALLSGVALWWPKTRSALRESLKVAVRKGRVRLWRSLHVAGGMYALVLLLAMALTGLTWSFQWYNRAVYAAFGIDAPQRKGGHGSGSKPAVTLDASAWQTVYDRLRFGLLSTTRLQGIYSWTEGRLSANITPVDWVDAGVNVAMSSFGASFGWIVNFHPKGFNFFVGMDQLMGKVNPQFIPVDNMNMNLSFGMNVTF